MQWHPTFKNLEIKIILLIFSGREFKLSATFFSIWIRIFSARFSQTPYKRASEDLCRKQWVKNNLGVASSYHTPQLSSEYSAACTVRSNLVDTAQGCILLTSLSVISSKFIQKFAQKCQYFTLIDQSVPPDNFHVTCLLREESALVASWPVPEFS